MTREEIIKNLKYTMKKHKSDNIPTFGTDIYLMCKDILDYLEQEPCEDCISRKEILDIVNNPLNIRLDEIIKKLPPATPKPKTGHWIRVTDKAGHLVWECKCGWQQRFNTNYCPFCGSYNGGNDNGNE